MMKLFLIIFTAFIYSNFTYSETFVRDNLNGKMLLCENRWYQDDLSNNPDALIIKDILIKFHADIGFNNVDNETEYKAEVSMSGFVPDDFYSNIKFKEPLETLAIGSVDKDNNSFLTNGKNYTSLTISDSNYIEDLPVYKTTTDNIFIGKIFLNEKGFSKNYGWDYEKLTDDLIFDWLQARGPTEYGGIQISRKDLIARFTYSWFPYGKYRREQYEIKVLSCELTDNDIQQDMFKLERRHYAVIEETKKQIKENDLKSKEGNLL